MVMAALPGHCANSARSSRNWHNTALMLINIADHLPSIIREGAVLLVRMRPKAMTVTVIVAGLLPIMWSMRTGSEVTQSISAPMVGGMVSAPVLSMFVIPVVYYLIRRPRRQ